jgi:hypothetical protein
MSKSKLGILVAAIATSSVLGVSGVSANPQSGTQMIQNMNRDALIPNPTLQNTNAQVTSVSQFSDVQPTDWAFTALQSLVERYGCIAGYPNGTFRGNRATSRYEFAAGLNACLDKINELISAGLAEKVGKEDLATLQKLQEEFSAELTALKGRVSALETKTATLEAQQFATTTKLTGSVVLGAIGSFGNQNSGVPGTNGLTNNNQNITFGSRVRLNFNTSFTGRDLLFTRLQASSIFNNAPSVNSTVFPAGSGALTGVTVPNNLTRVAFDENGSTNVAGATQPIFTLDRLYYRFPITSQINLIAGTVLNIEDVLDVVNPDLVSGERGSISRFARRDPLVFRGQEGAGAAAQIKFNDQFAFNLAYLANNASVSTSTPGGASDNGLFGGGYSASAQLIFTPVKPLVLSFVYQRGYDPANGALVNGVNPIGALNITTGTGNAFATNPFFGTVFSGASSDRFGFQTNFDISPNLALNGRVSYASVNQVGGTGQNVSLLSWLASVTFKDLFAQGNQASIAFGQPPYVSGNNFLPAGTNLANPYHLEAFYRFQLSKNISITPGLITIFNPLSATAPGIGNDPVFVGVVRTSFTF